MAVIGLEEEEGSKSSRGLITSERLTARFEECLTWLLCPLSSAEGSCATTQLAFGASPISLFEHHPSRFLVTTQLAFVALPHLTPSVGLFFSYVIMSVLQYFDQGLSTPLSNPLSDINSLFKLDKESS